MKRIVLLAVMLTTLASASHLSQLMQRYKHAPESQRYRIMNQIKLEIARLNKARQRTAIRHLRSLNTQVQKRTKHRKKLRYHHRHTPRPSAQDILNGTHRSGGWHATSTGSVSGHVSSGGASGSVSGPGGSSASGSVSGEGASGSVSGPGGSGASGSFGPGGASGGFSMPGGGGVSGSIGGF